MLCQKVVYFPKFEGIEQRSLFPFVSLHYEDCENIILSLDAAFLPSSKHLTASVHLHQTNAGSAELGARGTLSIQHCVSSATSAHIVIFKKHLAEYIGTNTKHSQPTAKGFKGQKTLQGCGFKQCKPQAILKCRINLPVSLVKICY